LSTEQHKICLTQINCWVQNVYDIFILEVSLCETITTFDE
jgi:hypothetical protein